MKAVLLAVFAALVLVAQLVAAVPTQLNYKKGQEFVFRLDASVDARGANGDSLDPHAGSFSTMNGTVVMQCTDVDAESYLFVMNMFDVYVGVGQSAGAQAPETEMNPVAVGSQALGYNMYFKQMKNGEIVTIWYDKADSAYFVQVKVGAINAFQTRVVAPGNSQSFVESDPVGKHTSLFTSTGTSALSVTKIFNQNDVTSWATDEHLSSKNVLLEYAHVANLDASGFIAGASLQQTVLLTNTPTSAASPNMRVGLAFPQQAAAGDDGFNMLMRSRGDMTISLRSHRVVDQTTTLLTGAPILDFAGVSSSPLKEDTMFAFAAKAGATAAATAAPPIDPEATVKAIIKGDQEDAKDSPRTFALMNQLIQYLNVFPERVDALLRTYLADPQAPRTRLFYILASLARNVESELLLAQYGLSSDNRDVMMSAIFAAGSIEAPTSFIANALYSVFSTSTDAEVSSSALLAYASVVGRLHEDDPETERLRRETSEILLAQMYGRASGDAQSISLAVRAIANAGPTVVELKKIPFTQVLNALRNTNEVGVRVIKVALKHLIARYAATVSISDELVSEFASMVVANNDDFPFNKSYTKDILIGGKKLNLDVQAQLFVGTNFDCKHDYFNYEGLAQVTGDLSLFDSLVQAFDAHAIYGKVNGSPLANELLLVVLGKTLYQKPIPAANLDCSLHTYNLFHAQPAISAKYVVWVSVIPIVFQASAGLTVNVDWGWQVCDSDLSAMVQIVPAAGAEVSGSVLIDLLVIKGGIQLAGSINSAFQPEAYIHGSKCTVGFDVHWKASAMKAYFQSFYQVKKCKFLIWNCKWQPEKVQTWWQWSHPAKDEIIYQKEWQIVRA